MHATIDEIREEWSKCSAFYWAKLIPDAIDELAELRAKCSEAQDAQSCLNMIQDAMVADGICTKATPPMFLTEAIRAHVAELRTEMATSEARHDDLARGLTEQVYHWKDNHDAQVSAARLLKERVDLPVERVKAYDELLELRAKVAATEEMLRWRETDKEQIPYIPGTQFIQVDVSGSPYILEMQACSTLTGFSKWRPALPGPGESKLTGEPSSTCTGCHSCDCWNCSKSGEVE